MMLPRRTNFFPISNDNNEHDDERIYRNYNNPSLLIRPSSSPAYSTDTMSVASTSERLGADFKPGPYDVICARGKQAFTHPGNKYFRNYVEQFADKYATTINKAQRSSIVSDIVDKIRSLGNGFVKQDEDGYWVEVGDTLAREKAGQILRNVLSPKYKSSVNSKKQRRHETTSKIEMALHKVMVSNNDIQETTETMSHFAKQLKVPDEDVVAHFTKSNIFMLDIIKADKELGGRFQKTALEFTETIANVNDDDIQ